MSELSNAIEVKPVYERGRKAYTEALCSRCHQIGTTGTPMGPNLSGLANRFARRDILRSVIEPSAVVAEIFRNHVIIKKDGSTVMGRVVRNDFRRAIVTVADQPFDPWHFTTISKTEIKSTEVSPVSPMPPGLLDSLRRDEIEQLLFYLKAAGNPRHPIYGQK